MEQHNINIDNHNKCFLISILKIISKGSCDAEDSSNGADHRNKLDFKTD